MSKNCSCVQKTDLPDNVKKVDCLVKFKKNNENAIIPQYQHYGDACFDLHACIPEGDIDILPNTQVKVPTGLSCSFPSDFEMQIRPRSGLAAKNTLTITNSPGTIDSKFRGELMVLIFNLGKEVFTIKHGDRIAQGKMAWVPVVEIEEVDELDATIRGEGGFGSTGI